MKDSFFIFIFLLVSNFNYAQLHNNFQTPISINEDGSAPDGSAILDIQSVNKGVLVPRMDKSARNLITNPVTGLMIYQLDSSPGFYYYNGTSWIAANNEAITYSIGDFVQGGIVFWVSDTGKHGLVCAKSDQGTGIRWYAGTSGDTRAYGNHIGAGEINADLIIGSHKGIIGDDGNPYVAKVCKDLVEEGYTDWYLPSNEELYLMYQNKAAINATAVANGGSVFEDVFWYWSSTEFNFNFAWVQLFSTGYQDAFYKGSNGGNIAFRAIRAF